MDDLADGDAATADALDDIEIQAHRRRQHRDFHGDGVDDAEPDHVEAGCLHQRKDGGQGDEGHRHRLQEHAQHQVEHDDDGQHRIRAQLVRHEQLGELLRHAVVRHHEAEQHAGRQQQAEITHGAHGRHQRVLEAGDGEAAHRKGQQHRQQGGDGGGLGRRGNAGVDGQRDHQADDEDRAHRAQHLAQAAALRRVGIRDVRRIQPAPHEDHQAEQQHQHDAGHDAGDEQLTDRGVGDDAVEQQDQAGRDQHAERAAGGQHAAGQAVVVAQLLHLGQGHAADRERPHHRRAAHRTEAGACRNAAVGGRAAHPHPAVHELEQIGADGRAPDQFAQEHEQRHGQQDVVDPHPPQLELAADQCRRPALDVEQERQRRRRQRKRDGQPHADEQDQQGQQADTDVVPLHGRSGVQLRGAGGWSGWGPAPVSSTASFRAT